MNIFLTVFGLLVVIGTFVSGTVLANMSVIVAGLLSLIGFAGPILAYLNKKMGIK